MSSRQLPTNRCASLLGIFSALFVLLMAVPAQADATELLALAPSAALSCDSNDALSLVDRSRSGTTPCTVGKGHLLLESGYYQNASAVGGTALAAYPLLHVRYGLSSRTEVFVDPATAIAKSGLNGAGVYTWSPSGVGLREEILDKKQYAIGVDITDTPQSDETASLSTRERWDFGGQYRLSVTDKTTIDAAVGNTVFTQATIVGNGQSSLYARLALTQKLTDRLSASALFGRDAHIVVRSSPQSQLGLTLQESFSRNAVGDIELGSAMNASGDTKAHYLGFGVSFLH